MMFLNKPEKPIRRSFHIEFPIQFGENMESVLKRIPQGVNYRDVRLFGDTDFSGNKLVFICYTEVEKEEKFKARLEKYDKELKKYNEFYENKEREMKYKSNKRHRDRVPFKQPTQEIKQENNAVIEKKGESDEYSEPVPIL